MPTVCAGSLAWSRRDVGCAVAIGNFDGVHAGHLAVLAPLLERARRLGLPSVVYTFDPAPTAVLAPERHQPRILVLEDRVRLLGEAGVEAVVVESFTREFAARPARWFVDEVLGARLNARVVVVGHDFRFGMERHGDAGFLTGAMPDVDVVQVSAARVDGEVVSSSRVRKLVMGGAVESAAALLGRPHRLRGRVVQGDQRGRTIGFPTANIDNVVELLPAFGVYAGWARVESGPASAAVMNIGVRPTFAGDGLRVEVHVLGECGDIYGRHLSFDLVARLRGEQRFNTVEDLKARIALDILAARRVLA